MEAGLNGGGSLRVPFVGRGFGGGGAFEELGWGSRGGIRGTVTQSGSSVYAYGFEGRLGFG